MSARSGAEPATAPANGSAADAAKAAFAERFAAGWALGADRFLAPASASRFGARSPRAV